MEKEMGSLRLNEVWELVELPPNRRIIGSKWVFKRKVDADGEVKRYKARLVAQGCSQRFGLDYGGSTQIAATPDGPIHCLSPWRTHRRSVHETTEGFIEQGKEHLVCQLKRSIYGLKQSPRCWNHALDNRLKEMELKQTSGDPCLYIHLGSEGEMFLVTVYVDDIILGGKSEGPLHYFLRVKVIQIEKVERYGLDDQCTQRRS